MPNQIYSLNPSTNRKEIFVQKTKLTDRKKLRRWNFAVFLIPALRTATAH